MLVGDLRHRPYVHHLQQRIGWRFHPEQPRVRFDRLLHQLHVGKIDEINLNAHLEGDIAQQPVGAAVQIVTGHDVVTVLQHRNDGRRRTEPGRER